MRRLLFSGLLALCCFEARADLIPYSSFLEMNGAPVGRRIDFTGALEVPMFDASLGTLTGIQFRMFAAGGLSWETISRNYWDGFTDFYPTTEIQTLGILALYREGPVIGSGGEPCGTEAFPKVCPATGSKTTNSFLELAGAISDGSSTVAYHRRALSVAGAPPTSLADFIAASPGMRSMPISVSIEMYEQNYYMHGALLGDIVGGSMGVGLQWDYTYIPVTATPEPRHAGLLLAAVLGICVLQRKKKGMNAGEN